MLFMKLAVNLASPPFPVQTMAKNSRKCLKNNCFCKENDHKNILRYLHNKLKWGGGGGGQEQLHMVAFSLFCLGRSRKIRMGLRMGLD